ncbi:MAG: hypothetical protein HQM15_04100 [Deltaproteobacteria bacterium]|nr:hypothetical protein [Deltaproteobacteria bacterium]
MKSIQKTNPIALALALVFTLGIFSRVEAKQNLTDAEKLRQQQYAPPSTSPDSIQIGVPQVYYYYSTPYPTAVYGPSYYSPPSRNRPGFWNNKSPIPGQYVPYSTSPSSISIGTPTYYYPYGY